MFTSQKEQEFFFKHLHDSQIVLEYGSGESTIEISNRVKKLISIEHQESWYNKLFPRISVNCKLLLEKPNVAYIEGNHCGTYDEFKNYIESPLSFGPFDLILIDGRARVECSKVCRNMSHENTIIFVHDFNREEYQEITKILNHIETVETMAKFKIK